MDDFVLPNWAFIHSFHIASNKNCGRNLNEEFFDMKGIFVAH